MFLNERPESKRNVPSRDQGQNVMFLEETPNSKRNVASKDTKVVPSRDTVTTTICSSKRFSIIILKSNVMVLVKAPFEVKA